MANRYWVPVLGSGTGNWSDTAHWSTTSGGSGGADVPTSSDDVFIDSSSGFGSGGTITLDVEVATAHDFTSNSSHSYTVTLGASYGLAIYGSLTLENGFTFDCVDGSLSFFTTATGETITISGATINSSVGFYTTGSWILQDNLSISGQFYQENGTFDANDHNVTANDFYFYADTGYTPTIIMGSGTWEATGEYETTEVPQWFIIENTGEVVTITPETSTIKFSNASEHYKGFFGGGKTYNNFWFTGTGAGILYVFNSNTFNDFKVDTPPHTIIFDDTSTTTVTTFTVSGTVGNLITINSYDYDDDGLGQHTFFKSSGIVSCDYLDISNSNATGGATWYAGSHSVDTTNNDGWLFEDKPTPLSPKVIVKNKLNLLSIGSL